MDEKLNPVHPGEVLLEEFLKPMSLSQNRLSLENRCTSPAHQRDCAWQAAHHGRYRPAPGALLWNLPSVLDGAAERL
jgi:hypothetical protein